MHKKRGGKSRKPKLKKATGSLDTGLPDMGSAVRSNALFPACRLPNEVLSEIFMTLMTRLYFEFPIDRPYSWLQSTAHVCHRWRTVALGPACLWSYIIPDMPTLAREQLERSKDARLSVIRQPLSYSGYPDESLVTELLERHIGRFAMIRLNVKPDDVFSHLESSALAMRELMLVGLLTQDTVDSAPPLKLFGGDAPLLTRILTVQLNISFAILPNFRNLTELCVKWPVYQDVYRPQPSEVVAALRVCTALVWLRLVNALPPMAHGSFAPGCIQLPRLKVLELSHFRQGPQDTLISRDPWDALRCAAFAQLFDVPSDVEYTCEWSVPDHVLPMGGMLETFMSLMVRSAFARMRSHMVVSFARYAA